MRKFDTQIQQLKYKVLKEVAREAWNDRLQYTALDIPMKIVPGKVPTMRCCVYKERAIINERVKLAMGGDRKNPNVIQVIDIACDECPSGGYEVSNSCRGCLTHRCAEVCKFGAISFDRDRVAHIDKSKCVECGQCSTVCPFNAIVNRKRPCQIACKVKAIYMDEDKTAKIDYGKCISCGACLYQCPFGAISDKSYILDVIDIIKNSNNNKSYKVYAVVAPSISVQFSYGTTEQVISGLKQIGFCGVYEAALGADMVAYNEAKELSEKGFLMSSCCPAFVEFIKKSFPILEKNISRNLSPMAEISKFIKSKEPDCKIVFIGPCTAKKAEISLDEVRPYVDSAITFEELQALFDSRDIDISKLSETPLDTASGFGRGFARCGGLSEAAQEALAEQNIDFEIKPIACDGIEECRVALLKQCKNLLDGNFIEGMACTGGCIGGAGSLTHGVNHRAEIDKYGNSATQKTILSAIKDNKLK